MYHKNSNEIRKWGTGLLKSENDKRGWFQLNFIGLHRPLRLYKCPFKRTPLKYSEMIARRNHKIYGYA
ncbi:hypothetical protein Y032_0238g3289 [Ancylostoma ceylanicum]|uniref:Uncharacterized protein n=1 Tax=Ancylostoma ceylanicum TaxID=53326 RepID=A0A016SF35_9BILA|nr:hypothetical protein Y032_0238g3289 [Ancylostoma ceylanicum]